MYQGEKFKLYLERNQISKVDAAEKLGIARQSLYALFNSKNLLRETVSSILTTFNTTEQEVFGITKEVGVNNTLHTESDTRIPMYEVESSAGAVGMYNDFAEQKPIGYLQIPGFEDCSFAVPVWGHSMYPTFENGTWIVCKEIQNKESIVPGECYYIEWDDYRMVKRIIAGDNEDEIMLYSDNDQEIVKGRLKYAPFVIKKTAIRKLYLVKGVHKKLTH